MTAMDIADVQFRRRERCIACGSTDLVPIWVGSFGDPIFRANIPSDFYSVDVPNGLADRKFERVACRECEQSFHQLVLDDEWLQVLYSQWIDEAQIDRLRAHDQYGVAVSVFERGRQFLKHALRIRSLLGASAHDIPRILDFGCGEGDFLDAARVLGFECYGVDFGVASVEDASATATPVAPSLEALDAVGATSFDAATLFQVLEHLAEPLAVLEQIAVRLRPGGVLVVEVPDCTGIDVPRTATEFHAVDPLEHINHFTPKTLQAMCERAGFEPERRIPAHVTCKLTDVLRSEASRLHRPSRTSRYFRKPV